MPVRRARAPVRLPAGPKLLVRDFEFTILKTLTVPSSHGHGRETLDCRAVFASHSLQQHVVEETRLSGEDGDGGQARQFLTLVGQEVELPPIERGGQ